MTKLVVPVKDIPVRDIDILRNSLPCPEGGLGKYIIAGKGPQFVITYCMIPVASAWVDENRLTHFDCENDKWGKMFEKELLEKFPMIKPNRLVWLVIHRTFGNQWAVAGNFHFATEEAAMKYVLEVPVVWEAYLCSTSFKNIRTNSVTTETTKNIFPLGKLGSDSGKTLFYIDSI